MAKSVRSTAVAAAVAGILLGVCSCAVFFPSDPGTRSTDTGVMVDGDRVLFQLLRCPNENIESLTLYSNTDDLESLWQIDQVDRGDRADTSIFRLGGPPGGFTTTVPLKVFDRGDPVIFEVSTNRRLRVSAGFTIESLRPGKVLTDRGFQDPADFEAQTRDC
ncbi:hypothetical protein [Frankia sp. R43]|uniref:hypothetical protein n=1 Tax=Frankia sp. R43 TaxID=269536 RepID=UPI00128F5DF1|nr:hypothetical protein [Frankia sp. R43]